MWDAEMSILKNYRSDPNGNVAMMFAVSALMLLTGVGAAVDFSNMTRARAQLQAQVDAGVLAAATVEIERLPNGKLKNEEQTRREAAEEVLAANGYVSTSNAPTFTVNESSVTLVAETEYKPTFGGILGVKTVNIQAIAESGLGGQASVDIVLVLDNTESMRVSGKMEALKAGATNLIDAIESSDSETKIGIVPFARYVRIDDD